MGLCEYPDLTGHSNPETMLRIGNLINSANETSIPQLSPVVVKVKDKVAAESDEHDVPYYKKVSSTTEIVTFFPSGPGLRSGMKALVSAKNIHIVPSKTLFVDHRIKDIETFEFQKVTKIMEYVKKFGVVSFRMAETQSAIKFLQCMDSIRKIYKVNTYFGNNAHGRLSPISGKHNDKLTLFVSFFDLPYSIPVYNYRKADGMGIRFGLYWPESSNEAKMLWLLDEHYLVVSLTTDNVIFVDGHKVNNQCWISDSHISCLISHIVKDEERRKEMKKPVKKAKQSSSEKPVKKEGSPSILSSNLKYSGASTTISDYYYKKI
jgi:hypothetical protein